MSSNPRLPRRRADWRVAIAILLVGLAMLLPATSASAAPDEVWDRLAQCESSGNWGIIGKYHGGLQFAPSTWTAYKPDEYPDFAYQATREQQIVVAEKVLAAQGWGAWPACSSALGLGGYGVNLRDPETHQPVHPAPEPEVLPVPEPEPAPPAPEVTPHVLCSFVPPELRGVLVFVCPLPQPAVR